MKQLLKKTGFRCLDEMERDILFRAQRNACIFLVIALSSWSLYEGYKACVCHSGFNPFPCFLLGTAAVIQTFSRLIMIRNAVKDDDDSYETGPLAKIIVLASVTASITAVMIAAFLLMGVRI